MGDTPPVCELFYELSNWLARSIGVVPIERRTHVARINDDWSFAFNCTMSPVEHEGATLSPMTFVLSFRDFPVGVVDPFGGALMANGAVGAAEAELIALLQVASAKLPEPAASITTRGH